MSEALNDLQTEINNLYIVFATANQVFATPVLAVREIVQIDNIHALPCNDTADLGVINLRGTIISIVDLAEKLGIKRAGPKPPLTNAFVLNLAIENSQIGVLVDSVESIVTINTDSLQKKFTGDNVFETQRQSGLTDGTATINDKLVTLINFKSLAKENSESSK